MTTQLLNQFKENAKDALENLLNNLESDDTRTYFLVCVRNDNEAGKEGSPYAKLYNSMSYDYGWDWGVVEEELPDVVDEVADTFLDLYHYDDDDESEADNLHCYFGDLDDESLAQQGLEVVAWPESQCLADFPNYRNHCQLINDEEGLVKFGSSAYVVDINWLDDFRNDNFFDY